MRIPAVIGQKAAGLVGRQWALHEVAEWLATGTERLFLITGEPGSGKSVLAAWLAGAGPLPADGNDAAALEQVRASWSAACFCMIRGQDGGDVTPAWLITSLVKQLSARHQGFADAFLRVNLPEFIHQQVGVNQGTIVGHTGDLDVKIPDARDRYAQGVVEPLRALAEANPDRTFAILVDGVDEAFVGPEPTVVSLLARSGSLPGNVRFLVTTRSERALVTQLQDGFGGDVRHLDLSSGLGGDRNEEDVRLFVQARLANVDPGAPNAVVEQLALQAAGNFLFIDFLLDELAGGTRQLTDTAELPTGLFALYQHYLERIVPGFEERERGPEWEERYQPLLGTLSVALPAAPADRLPRWLEWGDAALSRYLQRVEQVTEWEPSPDPTGRPGGGGWRLYHRSLGDFLGTPYLNDQSSDNRFYVAPPSQHDRIARFYLKAKEDLWSGDWANCDDRYCLRNLVRHMAESLPALGRPADQASRTGALYDVVLDPGFRARQAEVLGGPAMYDDVRTAVEAGLAAPQPGDDDRLVRLVENMAVDSKVEWRGLAVEALVRLAGVEAEGFRRARDCMLRLLAADSPDAYHVALKAAAAAGAIDVFKQAVIDPRYDVNQAACLYAYRQWRPDDPDCLPVRLLRDLEATVTLLGQIMRTQDRQVLNSLAGLSLLIYAQHPDRADVVALTSALWYEVLRNVLKLPLLNQPTLLNLFLPVWAKVYSVRLLYLLFPDREEVRRFFASDRGAIARLVPFLDPAADITAHADDLAALLRSPFAVSRAAAGMVLGIHSVHDPQRTASFVRDLFGQLDGPGRRWVLRGHVVLMERTPAELIATLEDLTRTFVDENQADFLAADDGLGVQFDVDLLPLGLAYGRRGGPMTYLATLLSEAAASAPDDATLLHRVVRGLASVGISYPHAVLRTLRDSVPQLLDPTMEDSVAATLATIRVLHYDTVDLFLRDVGAPDRLRQLVATADLELFDRVHRFVRWVAVYNNGLHQALFHPRIRVGLQGVVLDALGTAKDGKALVRKVTLSLMEMLRQADYRLERWTEP